MYIHPKVLRVLAEEKISSTELTNMMADWAFTSVRGFNRRYFQWLFLFSERENALMGMQHMDLIEIGQGQNRMLEEHEVCGGEGCRACGWVGSVSRAVADSTAAAMDVVP